MSRPLLPSPSRETSIINSDSFHGKWRRFLLCPLGRYVYSFFNLPVIVSHKKTRIDLVEVSSDILRGAYCITRLKHPYNPANPDPAVGPFAGLFVQEGPNPFMHLSFKVNPVMSAFNS